MNRFKGVAKVLTWSMALLLVAFVAGCGDGGGTDPGALGPGSGGVVPGDSTCAAAGPSTPRVTSSNPTNGNQFVTTSTTGAAGGGKLITANFSLAMNPATINTTTFTLAPAAGVASVSYNAATKVATLTTSAALQPITSYTATITQGAMSATGTALACIYTWTFRTVTAPAAGPPPVSVNLGRAAPFAIASAAGVTNDLATNPPNSTINGDVALDDLIPGNGGAEATCNGASVGAAGGLGPCGGLPPILNGTVVSPLLPDAGVASGGIKADLNAAYQRITPANLPGATVLGCGVIGSLGAAGLGIGCAGNSILPPGVYISATASSIGVTGVLTLDGQGNADAEFIFQAPSSTLTTAAGALGAPGSTILLINGAKASNVWWQVGSSATIGTFALFQGNVLADTSITMGDRSTSCGRLLAGAVTATGAFTFDGNVVSVPGNVNGPPTCQ